MNRSRRGEDSRRQHRRAPANNVELLIASGADGRFAVDVDPGDVNLWFREVSAGYWIPTNQKYAESLAVGREQARRIGTRVLCTQWAPSGTCGSREGADQTPFPGSG